MTEVVVAVADDDAGFRQAIAATLREHGIEVIEAADGATLIAVMRRVHLALAITDLRMPRLTGTDVIGLMRSTGDTTPFLVITGMPDAMRREASRWGDVTVIEKPITEARLLDAVSALVPGSGATG